MTHFSQPDPTSGSFHNLSKYHHVLGEAHIQHRRRQSRPKLQPLAQKKATEYHNGTILGSELEEWRAKQNGQQQRELAVK